jgi:RNA polymerase sigma-70 factor, ECF subfamily
VGPEDPGAQRRGRGPAGPGLLAGGLGPVEADSVQLDRLFRRESGRAVATLIRVLGDFDLAEEAVQDAFVTAAERWPRDGMPRNPGGWIVATARNAAIDRIRRARTYEDKLRDLAALDVPEEADDMSSIPDDRLRLFFTCCHPALAPEARVALTLRTLGGLSTPEVARAFLTSETAMQQRIVRAKRKIRGANIPYVVPEDHDLPERLASVLAALYLVFNEGYLATASDSLVRRELCDEAIRLNRVLVSLMPDEPETRGLLALMLLQHSRRDARTDESGELVLLPHQDRSRWHRDDIAEGLSLVAAALRAGGGPYTVQAAIAAEHAAAPSEQATAWGRIVVLYSALAELQPSPVVELNRAVAVAMYQGPERGLELIDALEVRGELEGYLFLHSARADLLSRLGREDEAAAAFARALELSENPVERRFLERRLAELSR